MLLTAHHWLAWHPILVRRLMAVLRLPGCLLILVLLSSTGCMTLMLAQDERWNSEPSRPRSAVLSPGSARIDVEREFGRAVVSRPADGGGRIDTYQYRVRHRPSDAYLGMLGAADTVLLGLGDLAFLPVEIVRRGLSGDRVRVEVVRPR